MNFEGSLRAFGTGFRTFSHSRCLKATRAGLLVRFLVRPAEEAGQAGWALSCYCHGGWMRGNQVRRTLETWSAI